MKNFKFILSNQTNPQFNIASEEYLLKHTDGFYVYLWRNSPCVIVGLNQNTLLEVNLKKSTNSGVKVVRRLTGGGAVYHDLENVCYTIIAPYKKGEDYYEIFTKPVIEYLNSLGANATFSGRNDITIDNKKISGNAQVVYKDRILHHGTILFNTNLDALQSVLIQNDVKVKSKGVKSIRARVVNVKDYLKNTSCDDFLNGLANYLKKDLTTYTFTNQDVTKINELVDKKYSTYEWNIGKSPKGEYRIDLRLSFGTMTFTFNLVNGIIENFEIFGDYFSNNTLTAVSEKLNGKTYTKDNFITAFKDISSYIDGANELEIADKIFS
ncbi:MAG: lipoate--protein ligase [Clostridia bacterium]|nr:lipoate--protein ligase [Clostridia bacterium]